MSKSRVIISGGHYDKPGTKWIEDSGATYGNYTEFEICQRIKNEVLKLIPNAIAVPSEYTLRQKIDWINSFCQPDDLVIEIHLNSNRDSKIEGTECYYSDVSYLAGLFSRHISNSLQTRDLGAIHDSRTWIGSLGWLRQIKAQNVLIEVCYLSNPSDRMKIVFPSGQMKAAQGIVNAINEHQGNLTLLDLLKQLLSKLMQLIK